MNLYGRARRLALYRTIVIIIISIMIVVFCANFIYSKIINKKTYEEFELMRYHFVDRGYSCERLLISGSKCILNGDNVKKTFYRFDDGFEYVEKTKSYSLFITHRLSKSEQIKFKTNSSAFDGVNNKTFICNIDDVFTKVLSCLSEDNIELNINSYLGIIEQAQDDLENAINYSGYSVDKLLTNYSWTKK